MSPADATPREALWRSMEALLVCLLAWLVMGPLAVFGVAAAAGARHRERVGPRGSRDDGRALPRA